MAGAKQTLHHLAAAAMGVAFVLVPVSAAVSKDRVQLAETRPGPLSIIQNSAPNSREAASQSLRMDNFEAQLRQLNGQVEELSHQLRQMQDQMRRMQGDMEYRLQQLEGGTGKRGDLQQRQMPTQPSTGQALQGQNPPGVSPTAQPDFTVGGQPPQLLGTVPANDLDQNGNTPPEDDQIGRAIGQPLDLSALASGRQSYGGEMLDPNGPDGPGDQFASVQPTNPRDAYDLAYGHVLRGEYGRAEESFRDFLLQYPDDRLAPSAKYWLGESLYSRGEYSDASQQFLQLYTNYPDSEKAPDALLKLGQSLVQLGETGTACATFGEMLKKYPKAARSVRSRAQSEQRKAGC